MRIVGGLYRGRPLTAPASQATRPTSDRLREALFNVLAHAYDEPASDARVLDLFAGTGALGLEALSRGASFALFVDDAAEARALIRQNIEALGLTGSTRIFRRDASQMGAIGTDAPYSLVFCDPPYGKGLAHMALSAAKAGGWFKDNAIIVVEELAGAFMLPPGFEELERRRYDASELTILQPSP